MVLSIITGYIHSINHGAVFHYMVYKQYKSLKINAEAMCGCFARDRLGGVGWMSFYFLETITGRCVPSITQWFEFSRFNILHFKFHLHIWNNWFNSDTPSSLVRELSASFYDIKITNKVPHIPQRITKCYQKQTKNLRFYRNQNK